MRSGHTGRPAWRGLRPLAGFVVVLAGVGLCAWEGTLRRTAAGGRWSVGGVIAVALLAAVVWGRRRQQEGSAAWARRGVGALSTALNSRATGRHTRAGVLGAAAWVALIAAAIGWDLYSFTLQLPGLPTFSRLFGDVTRHEWGRSVAFAGWLLLGGYLAVGWRRPPWEAGAARGTGDADADGGSG